MAKRAGLGRGLDGMFTSYIGKDTREHTGETDQAGKAEKQDQAEKTEKAEKAEKAEKGEAKTGIKTGVKTGARTAAKAAGKTGGSGRAGEKGQKSAAKKNTKTAAQSPKGSSAKSAAQTADPAGAEGVVMLKISAVEPNREQPRKEFQEEALNELAASIRQYGVIQPLVVQKRPDYYEIIAGERRWRAARLAGLKEVPVIIKDYTDQEIVEVSLIENIQREDLNPIEEALAYQRLLEEFSLRQEDIARRVSKNRTTITNSLRLLKLDERVRQMLMDGELSGGHARALLGLEDKELQYEAAKRIAAESLSVRDVEKLIKAMKRGAAAKPKAKETATALDLVCEDMAQRMKAVLGTQVRVNRKNKKAGRIEIEYYSMEELERLFDLIRGMKEE